MKKQLNPKDFSPRAYHTLRRSGIDTMEQLNNMAEEDIRCLNGLGEKTFLEIREKIHKYRILTDEQPVQETQNIQIARDIWEETPLDPEEFSCRTYNALRRVGIDTMEQLYDTSPRTISKIPGIGLKCQMEIQSRILDFKIKKTNKNTMFVTCQEKEDMENEGILGFYFTVFDIIHMPDYRDIVNNILTLYNKRIADYFYSKTSKILKDNGYTMMSELVWLNYQDFSSIEYLLPSQVELIINTTRKFILRNERKILDACINKKATEPSENVIRQVILNSYVEDPFAVASISEFVVNTGSYSDTITCTEVEDVVRSMEESGELKKVSGGYILLYPKFLDCFEKCTWMKERDREVIELRMQGYSMNFIAEKVGLTRERIRQLIYKRISNIRGWFKKEEGFSIFEEDRYEYFHRHYSYNRDDAVKYLGISNETASFLEMVYPHCGEKEIRLALKDENVNADLTQKITCYLNRNKVMINGELVPLVRNDIENALIKLLGKDSIKFSDFQDKFNAFLEATGIPSGSSMYFTEENTRSRLAHLSQKRNILWKFGHKMRYYEIDKRDYTKLYEELNLESYHDTMVSTEKLFWEHQGLMKQYDIRDYYELHNLIRKTVDESRYDRIKMSRMPEIIFGEFDRDKALMDLIRTNSPIATNELCRLASREFGFHPEHVRSMYLKPFSMYRRCGVYDVRFAEDHGKLVKTI